MLSYNEVRERVNLPDDDIMRLLHSLSCAKYRILNKAPVSKTISKTDTFSFNNRFTDKMRRIKVGLWKPAVDIVRQAQSSELYAWCGIHMSSCELIWLQSQLCLTLCLSFSLRTHA